MELSQLRSTAKRAVALQQSCLGSHTTGLVSSNRRVSASVSFCWRLIPRVSRTLTRTSYDWSFGLTVFAQPDISGSRAVIVYIDEDSLKELKQPLNAPMDRTLHAKLLDRLAAEGAKAVVMDIVFSDPGPDRRPMSDLRCRCGQTAR